MTLQISINERVIGEGKQPYIIAEMSANHNGNISNAKRIITAARECGADAVKLQTYRPDTITLDSRGKDFMIKEGLWAGMSLYELFEQAHMPWEWHKPLFEHAEQVGITLFSSPFDNTAVDLLEDLNTPAYKIASFEVIDLPLIKYAASTGKPMIISTGMANIEEIQEAIDAAQESGCKELAILHCVSGYPAPAEDYNLRTIPNMIKRFGRVTGLSDHTLDNTTAIASVVVGATIIEKHFTLDRTGGGPDDSFSLEPSDLASLCRDSKTAWQSLGKVNYECKQSEKGNIQVRRSLYFIKDMKTGEQICDDCVKSVRPGYGLAPKYYDEVVGSRVVRSVKSGDRVRREDISR